MKDAGKSLLIFVQITITFQKKILSDTDRAAKNIGKWLNENEMKF